MGKGTVERETEGETEEEGGGGKGQGSRRGRRTKEAENYTGKYRREEERGVSRGRGFL